MNDSKGRSHFADYVFSIIGAISLTIILIILIMRPPLGDMIYLVVLLSLTGAASGAVGFFTQRFGLWQRFQSLRHAIALGYVLAAALTLLNVWITAKLMFINEHDLLLASMLLFFASAISVAFGYFLSGSIAQRLDRLAKGAVRVSEGDFTTRITVQGDDEVARLTQMFNEMIAQLQKAAQQAEALDKSRRGLVAGASHDLRTPLAALRAMIDALADGIVDDPETTARYLEQSQAEIRRMSDLIDDLFELAQLDAGHAELEGEPTALSDLVSDMLASFTAQAKEKNVKLAGEVAPDVDPVWMDANKINRVLSNLLSNAIRHTPAGGKINIRAELRDGKALVSIQDTGEGIVPEDLPHIFDDFYRGEKSRVRSSDDNNGSGLGLAIARRLVEAHQGWIKVESTPGHGTTVRFVLPKDKAPQL